MDDEDIIRLQLAYHRSRSIYEDAESAVRNLHRKLKAATTALDVSRLPGRPIKRSPIDVNRSAALTNIPTADDVAKAATDLTNAVVAMRTAIEAVPEASRRDSHPLPESYDASTWEMFLAEK